ncbi:hypothetical protein [Streptomyces canus]|uniref:Dienelactone hydrolase n=1 Tax=Streptomyces canus TaxID=58343 RepID=A0AAW8FUM1_9ACTN|nr:hypothetical protein [Streptomyces canus]MDQ0758233.1 dienelactone hydrolase [Streptomyces canus]MDQ0913020.1 dienelactone hydrolase [Streptomyces canus]
MPAPPSSTADRRPAWTGAQAAHSFTRHDITFPSGDSTCAGGLYLPTGITSPPVVVLGHVLGATREMRLDALAERFAQAGITAVAFTYRHFGDSGGHPAPAPVDQAAARRLGRRPRPRQAPS